MTGCLIRTSVPARYSLWGSSKPQIKLRKSIEQPCVSVHPVAFSYMHCRASDRPQYRVVLTERCLEEYELSLYRVALQHAGFRVLLVTPVKS